MGAQTEMAFAPIDLQRWDQMAGDLFVVCVWSDVRPLRGAAGLLDWRLNGKLSHWIRQGRMSGADGEKTLVPTTRLPWRNVLVLGLGSQAEFSADKLRAAATRTFDTMRGLHLHSVAMAPPGRSGERISPEHALQLLAPMAQAESGVTRFTIVDTPAAIRNMLAVPTQAALVPATTPATSEPAGAAIPR